MRRAALILLATGVIGCGGSTASRAPGPDGGAAALDVGDDGAIGVRAPVAPADGGDQLPPDALAHDVGGPLPDAASQADAGPVLPTPDAGPPPDGPIAKLIVSTTVLTFEPRRVGSSSPIEIVAVANVGLVPAEIIKTTVTGEGALDFQLSNGCGGQLAPSGGNCHIRISFAPKEPGMRMATIQVTEKHSAVAVALSGLAF